ncbi:MAG: hypothetical protein M1828_007597 [Chrysothrix sp. TS-e1954]|nr:MAG: hypothetical protein M1828_007597 [Chrysothrix sp. TS-e1954]
MTNSSPPSMSAGHDRSPSSQLTSSSQATEKNGKSSEPSASDTKVEPEAKGPSNAERKKQAKAEKQARRAQDKAETQPEGGHSSQQKPAQSSGGDDKTGKQKATQASPAKTNSQSRPEASKQAQKQAQQPPSHSDTQNMPHRPRRRSSTSASISQTPKSASSAATKQVPFLAHLYPAAPPNPPPLAHPCIQTLTQLQRTHTLVGSHARTIALLTCLKTLVRSYTTPPSTALPRHLPNIYLSPHLAYLKAYSRPFCAAQAASIRWFKRTCSKIDPSVPEEDAKRDLCREIDVFTKERLTIADEVIAATASEEYITPGSTILVYANSAVVRSALAHAIRSGVRPLRITIVDSRPMHEGKALAKSLISSMQAANLTGDDTLDIELIPLTALAHFISDASAVLLGASAIHPNGAVTSRSGSAMVALAANQAGGIPVVVLAEGIKFVERAAVDSLGGNELAPEEALLDDAAELETWRKRENAHLVGLLYDTMPRELVDAVVTEYGRIEPGAAGMVQRLAGVGLGDEDAGGGGVG